MLVKAGPIITSIYKSWLEYTHQPFLRLRSPNLRFNKTWGDLHAQHNLSTPLKLFCYFIYLNIFPFFFFFLKKMRVKISVNMAFKFYKISSEPLHLQWLRTTALLGQTQRLHVMALTTPGSVLYQWPGYGGCWGETAPMHISQDCSSPSHPLESCTCTTASSNHRACGWKWEQKEEAD